jgi:DNA-binding LytR/AlgR family response regulator
LFAFLLFGVSSLLNSDPWKLSWLIKEKLTSRLYIVIAVYFVYCLLEYRRSRGNLVADSKFQDRLTFKAGSKIFVVDTSSIRWIQADAGYLEIHTPEKVHVVVDSLKHMLTLLDPEQFRRIHKSTIVNLRMIDSFRSRHNGDYDVLLKDGSNIRLSRNYAKPLKGTLL